MNFMNSKWHSEVCGKLEQEPSRTSRDGCFKAVWINHVAEWSRIVFVKGEKLKSVSSLWSVLRAVPLNWKSRIPHSALWGCIFWPKSRWLILCESLYGQCPNRLMIRCAWQCSIHLTKHRHVVGEVSTTSQKRKRKRREVGKEDVTASKWRSGI